MPFLVEHDARLTDALSLPLDGVCLTAHSLFALFFFLGLGVGVEQGVVGLHFAFLFIPHVAPVAFVDDIFVEQLRHVFAFANFLHKFLAVQTSGVKS